MSVEGYEKESLTKEGYGFGSYLFFLPHIFLRPCLFPSSFSEELAISGDVSTIVNEDLLAWKTDAVTVVIGFVSAQLHRRTRGVMQVQIFSLGKQEQEGER